MKTDADLNIKLEQISFLPKPTFNPAYPTPNTLPARALSFMLNGEMLNHPDFEKRTGSWRLAAVVFILRELGWPVESFEQAAPTTETPCRYISCYFLPQKIIQAVFGGGHHD